MNMVTSESEIRKWYPELVPQIRAQMPNTAGATWTVVWYPGPRRVDIKDAIRDMSRGRVYNPRPKPEEAQLSLQVVRPGYRAVVRVPRPVGPFLQKIISHTG